MIINGHAGERETSSILYLRPDLVEMDSANNESGANQHRLNIPNVYTAIWWYADFPNHYAGEGSKATKGEGQLITEHTIGQLVEALRAIKADTKTLQLQKEYFDKGHVNPQRPVFGPFVVTLHQMERYGNSRKETILWGINPGR